MWSKILAFFSKNVVKSQPITPQPPVAEQKPIPQVQVAPPVQAAPVTDPLEFWKAWCKKAIDISQSFEGSDPWANITGNFDGAYLTCGALGFTWKYNNQPPMILKFLAQAGAARAKELMPKYWDIYLNAANLGENGGAGIVASWSNGSAHVQKDVSDELRALWRSPEMIKIQVETAWAMMGNFAYKKCVEGQKYFNLSEPKFSHYAYWFDQGVLNGTGNTVQFGEETSTNKATVIDWCKTTTIGYAIRDLKNNSEIWDMKFDLSPKDQQALFIMAYLRAIKSRQQFMPVTMNRRGTVALGDGFVNGDRRSFDWKV